MLSDMRRIRVTDMGAGSLKKLGEERRVSDIAVNTALPKKEARLLSRIISGSAFRVPPDGIILELGTSLGISTLAMSLAAPEHKVVTVEGCPALAEIAASNLERHGAGNVTVLNMEFSTALEKLRAEGQKVAFSFIDGNHRGTALTEYAGLIAEMGEEMIIIADDIHLTRDMYRGWQRLVVSGIAPATMETFRFGILFLISGLTPGNYRIRY
jgi:predicted O-methyltransferase YrrM